MAFKFFLLVSVRLLPKCTTSFLLNTYGYGYGAQLLSKWVVDCWVHFDTTKLGKKFKHSWVAVLHRN